jgi:hypothetical protein
MRLGWQLAKLGRAHSAWRKPQKDDRHDRAADDTAGKCGGPQGLAWEPRQNVLQRVLGKTGRREIGAKISAAKIGWKPSAETRAKARAALLGRKIPAEQIAKMRGRKLSPEQCAKMRGPQTIARGYC